MGEETIDAQARAELQGHIDVCTERYGNIWDKLGSIERQFSDVHNRFNLISNRMWSLVVGTCGAAIFGLAGVCFYLLTRGRW